MHAGCHAQFWVLISPEGASDSRCDSPGSFLLPLFMNVPAICIHGYVVTLLPPVQYIIRMHYFIIILKTNHVHYYYYIL